MCNRIVQLVSQRGYFLRRKFTHCEVRKYILATFRSEDEIDYEYDFRISNQSHSQSPRSSLLLTSREGGSRNKIGVRRVDVNPAH